MNDERIEGLFPPKKDRDPADDFVVYISMMGRFGKAKDLLMNIAHLGQLWEEDGEYFTVKTYSADSESIERVNHVTYYNPEIVKYLIEEKIIGQYVTHKCYSLTEWGRQLIADLFVMRINNTGPESLPDKRGRFGGEE